MVRLPAAVNCKPAKVLVLSPLLNLTCCTSAIEETPKDTLGFGPSKLAEAGIENIPSKIGVIHFTFMLNSSLNKHIKIGEIIMDFLSGFNIFC